MQVEYSFIAILISWKKITTIINFVVIFSEKKTDSCSEEGFLQFSIFQKPKLEFGKWYAAYSYHTYKWKMNDSKPTEENPMHQGLDFA